MQETPNPFMEIRIRGCRSLANVTAVDHRYHRYHRLWCLIGVLCLVTTIASASAQCVAPAATRKTTSQKDRVTRLSQLGGFYQSSGKYACAADAFGKAVALEPYSPALAYRWGLNLHAAGKDVEALEALSRARRLNPQDLQVHLLLGAVLDQLKRRDDAETEWRDSLVIDPNSSIALDALSKDLIARHDYAGIIALLEKRSPMARLSAEQTVDLGTALAALARLGDAVQILRDGLAVYPDSLPIARQLALVLMIMDRPREASQVFELALRNHPRDQQTQTMYLQALVLSRSEYAAEQAEKVLSLYPDDWQVLYLKAVVDSRALHFDDARRHLERAITLNPSYEPAHAELGKVLEELGNLPAAKSELEKAEALGDSQVDVHYQLALVLRRLGETESAKDKLRAVQQSEDTRINESRAAVLAVKADHIAAIGDPQQAATLYREALAITPDDGSLHYKLAKALDLLNDTAGERAELVRSIQLSPNLCEAQNQLGFLAVRTGNAQEAENYFHAALRASPSYLLAWVNLAAALASEGKWPEAQDAVDGALRLDPQSVAARDLQQAIRDARNQ